MVRWEGRAGACIPGGPVRGVQRSRGAPLWAGLLSPSLPARIPHLPSPPHPVPSEPQKTQTKVPPRRSYAPHDCTEFCLLSLSLSLSVSCPIRVLFIFGKRAWQARDRSPRMTCYFFFFLKKLIRLFVYLCIHLLMDAFISFLPSLPPSLLRLSLQFFLLGPGRGK